MALCLGNVAELKGLTQNTTLSGSASERVCLLRRLAEAYPMYLRFSLLVLLERAPSPALGPPPSPLLLHHFTSCGLVPEK